MATQQNLPLSAPVSSGTTVINGHCTLRAEGEYRVVAIAGSAVHHYSADDAVAEAYAMVMLVDGGFATQEEVAVGFGFSERTVRRHQRRYADGGMTALAVRSGWRPGRRRIPTKRRRIIERLRASGVSNREIARRLGITENAVREQVGPTESKGQQHVLPFAHPSNSTVLAVALPTESANSPSTQVEPTAAAVENAPSLAAPNAHAQATKEQESESAAMGAMSLDVDPTNRIWDRLLACFGYLDDATPLFADVDAVPGAGVLFALPALVHSGVFRIAHKLYGEVGPAFYGLRTILLTLLLMALWRIKRPEALKEHDPQALGRILGLDRAPEVKTVRRKLTRLAAFGKAQQLGAELAQLRVSERGQLMGFLYVDGHVRAYHGKRKVPKAHVARMRLSMPATTDYWVNDASGDPLFVLTAQANTGLAKLLPDVLAQVRQLVGDRRVTVVFDRGGWSPKLFKKLIEENFDILTYRKGRSRCINKGRFVLRRARLDGREVEYRLHDQPVRFLDKKLRLRQVTRLSDDGHQTQVITSRWDLPDIEIAYRMFERWRQENFFKYMREEFLLDALVDYQIEPDDPTRTVPNPERRQLDTQVQEARSDLAKLEQAYGAAALDNQEDQRPTMRGFKIANGKLGKQLRAARERLDQLRARRRGLPQRVEVRDVSEAAVIKLATERKHLTNLIKMLAYQAESDLLALVRQTYARVEDEGRTLLHELFRAPADVHVNGHELVITLRPLSSPHRTLAVQGMCEALNTSTTLFPGSHLTIRFAVHPPHQIGMAFPGPREIAVSA